MKLSPHIPYLKFSIFFFICAFYTGHIYALTLCSDAYTRFTVSGELYSCVPFSAASPTPKQIFFADSLLMQTYRIETNSLTNCGGYIYNLRGATMMNGYPRYDYINFGFSPSLCSSDIKTISVYDTSLPCMNSQANCVYKYLNINYGGQKYLRRVRAADYGVVTPTGFLFSSCRLVARVELGNVSPGPSSSNICSSSTAYNCWATCN